MGGGGVAWILQGRECLLNVETVAPRGSGVSEVNLSHKIKPSLQNVPFPITWAAILVPFWGVKKL